MKIDPSSEALIRRYLLADVTDDEREKVEGRLMVEDGFFELINLAEDELIDEYLDRTLSHDDYRRFQETFLCAPERQHKLRFFMALREYVARTARAGASERKDERVPWWRSIIGYLNPPRPVLAYSLAVALLSIAIGGPSMLVRMARLERRIEGLQVQQQGGEARESTLRSQYEEQRAMADRIAAQLRQEREKRSSIQPSGGSGSIGTGSPFTSTLAIVLTPGMTRDAQSSPALDIPRATSLVALDLDLSENRFKAYRAVLLSEGQEILSRSGLKARENTGRVVVRLILPASDLQRGDYLIRLYGQGQADSLETYMLRVTGK